MSSDHEAGPSEKSIKLDTTDTVMDARTMNKLFPKIDNLEHFPLKVLLNIFTRLNDIDLYNLAEESTRFEKIAKIVLNERYTHQYFIIDESKNDWKRNDDGDDDQQGSIRMYDLFFQRFGKEIKAIEIKNVYISYKQHWITRLMDETKSLKKLILDKCRIEYENLLQHAGMDITHLALRDSYSRRFVLPDYRNLKKLEIWIHNSGIISMESMVEIFRNNPALESLILGEKFGILNCIGRSYPFGELMRSIEIHLNRLKQLTYVSDKKREWDETPNRQPDHIVDGFVRSLKHLESLTLSSTIDNHTNFYELLCRLNSECANIKHLKLYYVDGKSNELFNVIRSFNRIESLALRFNDFGDENEDVELPLLSMMEHLPYLRHLTLVFDINFSIDWFYITLQLLQRSQSLDELTLESDYEDGEMEIIGTTQYYDRFIEIIQNQKVKLKVNFKNELIGSVSKNEVIWRNKLMQWMGYNLDQNSSNINLLDLDKKSRDTANDEQSNSSNVKQCNPFDLILDYLDLNSLYSLSKVSKKCSQLVQNYMKQHSQRHGTFTITNEFSTLENGYYDGLELFAEYVINLRADIFHQNIDALRNLLRKFHNLTKLCICTAAYVRPHDLIVPQVRHLIYDGSCFNGYSDLYNLSCECPDLEKMKLKKEMRGNPRKVGECLKFRKLKKIYLKHDLNIQNYLSDLKAIFKNTKTELFLRI